MKVVILLILISLCFAIPGAYRRYAIPFRLSKLNIELPFCTEWESKPDEKESKRIKDILSQSFRYLNKGRQSFAFESNDQQYVLKLFRSDAGAMNYGSLILSWCKKHIRKHIQREIRPHETIGSCKLAYDLLREETGITCVHLNPREGLWPIFCVQDYLGFSHQIDPSKYRFAIQKKGERMLDSLKKALANDPDAFHRMIQSFSSLLRTLKEKNIAVMDSKMPSNFGYFGEEAFQLDFASNLIDPDLSEKQIAHFRERLSGWLEQMEPDSVKYLNE